MGGGGSVLTTVLMHFPELEPVLELFGSRYIVDLMGGQLEAFFCLCLVSYGTQINERGTRS
jgi:hypothetical protein